MSASGLAPLQTFSSATTQGLSTSSGTSWGRPAQVPMLCPRFEVAACFSEAGRSPIRTHASLRYTFTEAILIP